VLPGQEKFYGKKRKLLRRQEIKGDSPQLNPKKGNTAGQRYRFNTIAHNHTTVAYQILPYGTVDRCPEKKVWTDILSSEEGGLARNRGEEGSSGKEKEDSLGK